MQRDEGKLKRDIKIIHTRDIGFWLSQSPYKIEIVAIPLIVCMNMVTHIPAVDNLQLISNIIKTFLITLSQNSIHLPKHKNIYK